MHCLAPAASYKFKSDSMQLFPLLVAAAVTCTISDVAGGLKGSRDGCAEDACAHGTSWSMWLRGEHRWGPARESTASSRDRTALVPTVLLAAAKRPNSDAGFTIAVICFSMAVGGVQGMAAAA